MCGGVGVGGGVTRCVREPVCVCVCLCLHAHIRLNTATPINILPICIDTNFLLSSGIKLILIRRGKGGGVMRGGEGEVRVD